MSIVRKNLLTEKNYTPYCGGDYGVCGLPRTVFNGSQFKCSCSSCSWVSDFPDEFIQEYKKKWGIK